MHGKRIDINNHMDLFVDLTYFCYQSYLPLGGMYGSCTYGSGTYGSGMYGSGTYGSDPYASDPYASGTCGSGTYGSGTYGSGTYVVAISGYIHIFCQHPCKTLVVIFMYFYVTSNIC